MRKLFEKGFLISLAAFIGTIVLGIIGAVISDTIDRSSDFLVWLFIIAIFVEIIAVFIFLFGSIIISEHANKNN